MAITKEEVIGLGNAFHEVSGRAGSAAEQARFFLHPEPRIFVLHGEDVTLQVNHEIHSRLTDERCIAGEQWEITPLCDAPERVRAVGAFYWEGRLRDSAKGSLIKCIVGEDWIIQRQPSGDLKFALYMNTYHNFLPDSAPMALK